LDKEGVAKRGLIIRHLLLPNLLPNTEGVFRFIATHLPKDTYISFMSQYLPLYKAKRFPKISRAVTKDEYEKACRFLESYGLDNGWIQKIP